MKGTLLSLNGIITLLFLFQFTCVVPQMVKLPNAGSLKRKVVNQTQGIPSYTVQPRNYKLNFSEKTFYNIKLGDFVSDHNVSIQEGGNELSILTNNNGKCWAIVDYINADRKTRPENKHYEIIAKKIYTKGKWTLGRIGRYSGIYCVENNLSILIYYTGNNLVVEFTDKSLKSASLEDKSKVFTSMNQFIAYQNEMGNTPDERQNYLETIRENNNKRLEEWLQKEKMLITERNTLYKEIDSLKSVFKKYNHLGFKSIKELEIIEKDIPEIETYKLLRDNVDKYNLRVDTFKQITNKHLGSILVVESGQSLIGLPSEKNFLNKVTWAKNKIKDRKNELIAHEKEYAQKQKDNEERNEKLRLKYGAAFERYEKEGFYDGMSFELVRAITTILIPDGIINGVKYYNGPFEQRFGFKNNKLVYFSGF